MGIRELEPATSVIFLFVEGKVERKRQVGKIEGAGRGLLSEMPFLGGVASMASQQW